MGVDPGDEHARNGEGAHPRGRPSGRREVSYLLGEPGDAPPKPLLKPRLGRSSIWFRRRLSMTVFGLSNTLFLEDRHPSLRRVRSDKFASSRRDYYPAREMMY